MWDYGVLAGVLGLQAEMRVFGRERSNQEAVAVGSSLCWGTGRAGEG